MKIKLRTIMDIHRRSGTRMHTTSKANVNPNRLASADVPKQTINVFTNGVFK